jgi:hypothetical protein
LKCPGTVNHAVTTNDDGIESPGIRALAEQLRSLGALVWLACSVLARLTVEARQ